VPIWRRTSSDTGRSGTRARRTSTSTAAVASGRALAQTGELGCGDTITADTTLESDLTGCASNGIVIGADDITLDLNGHTISGDGKPVRRCPRRQICDVGIANDGHDGAKVRNGSLHGFATGVLVAGVRDNRLAGLSSSGNQFFGFVIAESARTVLRDSSGNDNPAPDGDGLGVFASHDLRVVNNSFRRNGLGMHLESSTDNLIKGNVVARNSDFGIFLEADGNQVRGNRSVRDRVTGIVVGPGSRNVIAGNGSPEAARGSASRRAAATWSPATSSLARDIRASGSGSGTLPSGAPALWSGGTSSSPAARTATWSKRATDEPCWWATSHAPQATTASTSRAPRRGSCATARWAAPARRSS
jgi:parallel beta-helix repeat protein